MDLLSSVILALVQGITEFLPVSSSGHLTIASSLLRLQPSLTLDILLNTATLVSVLFFFRKQANFFFTNIIQIIIGTIPAIFVGLCFKDQIEILFSSTRYLPYFFIITSLLLFSTRLTSKSKKQQPLTIKKAFIIGLFQALAILPAVSRSGATISSALLLGLSPLQAFNFSFALFIPASFGALILDAKKISSLFISPDLFVLVASFLVTVIIGIFALKILQKVLTQNKLWYFGIYTALLALVLLAFSGTLI